MRLSPSLEEEVDWTPVPRFSTVTPFSVTLLQSRRHSFPLPCRGWSCTVNQQLSGLHPEAEGQLSRGEEEFQKANPLPK